MDTFEQLRKTAIEKRENAIALARAEYRQSLAKIKQLERYMGKRRVRTIKPRPLGDLICDVMPKDRLFTIGEVVELMEVAEPGRVFPTPTVRAYFQILRKQGLVRRVKRADRRYVLWAAEAYKTAESEFGATNMRMVVESILRERGPLMVAELIVIAQSRGYRPDADPRMLLDTAAAAMRSNPTTFRRDRDGRWLVIS